MRLLVSGSQSITDYERFLEETSHILEEASEIICGGCAIGVDVMAIRYARDHDIPSEGLPIDWGSIDKFLAVWDGVSDGSATEYLINLAEKEGVATTCVVFR
jgi:hypothetical protein